MLSLLSMVPGIAVAAKFGGAAVDFLVNCRVCMIAIAVIVVFLAGDIRGHHVATARCKADDLAQQLAAAKRDLSIKMGLAKLAQDRSAQLVTENSVLSKKVSDYEATLTNSCLLTKSDIKKLEPIK